MRYLLGEFQAIEKYTCRQFTHKYALAVHEDLCKYLKNGGERMKSAIKTICACIAFIIFLFATFAICGAGWQMGKMLMGA